MKEKLGLSKDQIVEARSLATSIVAPVLDFIDGHTTVTVERATLRIAGADGANDEGVPVPNLVVDQLKDRLEGGALVHYVNALLKTGGGVADLNRRIAEGYQRGL